MNKIIPLIKRIFLFLAIISLTSCGYTYGVTKQSLTKKENTIKVYFTSYPNDADVIIFGNNMGKTPLELDLKPVGNYKGVITKKGYTNKEFTLYRLEGEKNGWCYADAFGMIFILPAFSFFSDYCATLSPQVIFATLDEGSRINIKMQ